MPRNACYLGDNSAGTQMRTVTKCAVARHVVACALPLSNVGYAAILALVISSSATENWPVAEKVADGQSEFIGEDQCHSM